jgi:hypothetical protein
LRVEGTQKLMDRRPCIDSATLSLKVITRAELATVSLVPKSHPTLDRAFSHVFILCH